MPLIPLILGIILVYVLHKLIKRSQKGGGVARWVLGGGMIVTLLLVSRVFGARVLYAFLPAIQAWMAGGGSGAASKKDEVTRSDGMSREEALLILGIEETANEQQVKAAYKQLMMKLHPDQGGNDYLASKLNRAKDTLLG